MVNIHRDFKKVKDVVLSCENVLHLKAAKRFINIWFKLYTKQDGKGHFYAEEPVQTLYERLLHSYNIKRYQIKHSIDYEKK